jgi:glycerophosphoryl diester phosphodiesterase
MIALKRDPDMRRPRANPGLDRDIFVRPIAHRGLHDRIAGRIENTAAAFGAAIDKGYGIECDLQPADDGTPMVFHDEKLDRLVAASGLIGTCSPSMLARLRYKGSDQKILTFAQFLELVDGRVPLLVEVKGRKAGVDAAFVEKIARQARAYEGPIALMSFNRAIVMALGERAPKIPRGEIVGGQQVLASLWTGRRGTRERTAASRALGTGHGSVSFYAVDVKLVAGARKWMSRHAPDLPLFTWTVRTPRQRAAAARWADAPIFEGYEA